MHEIAHIWLAIFHWFQNVTGTNDGFNSGSTRWYNFHSGFEGNIPLYALAGGFYWHHTCHQDRCWHWARYTTDAGDKICKTHHPDMGKGFKLTASHILRRHKKAGDDS